MTATELLTLAKKAAEDAADLLSLAIGSPGVLSSVDKDIKTQADLAADKSIQESLNSSGHPIVSEEGEWPIGQDWRQGTCWVIDPLDGTLNFTRQFPISSVSIGLCNNGVPVLGVVRDLFQQTTYFTDETGKSWCGDVPLAVSNISRPVDAVIATGFPSGRSYDEQLLLTTVNKVRQYKKVRMLGCASMMITMVACGVFDVYEEEDIYLWDVAAALALVKGAGGEFEMTPGSGPWKFNVRATNGIL